LDIHFVGADVEDIVKRLTSLGFPPTHEVGSYTFPSINLAVYAPEDKVLSVSLFKEGYYDGV
jgi:hypothetical protein